MNGLDRIGMNPLPLQVDSMVTGGASALNARTAGPGAGSVAQQGADLLSNRGGNVTRPAAPLPPAGASTYATVSMDAQVLNQLSRLPGATPQILGGAPLLDMAPSTTSGANIIADSLLAADAATPANAAAATGKTGASGAATAATALSAKFTEALVQSLEGSGLFYESHLAEWASGQRSITTLDREPQARLSPVAPEPSTPNNTSAPSAASAAIDFFSKIYDVIGGGTTPLPTTPAPTQGGASSVALSQAALQQSAAADKMAQAVSGSHGNTASLSTNHAIHPDIVDTVRQQLDLLQNPLVRWSGEAWPGAKMDWEIERRDEHGQRSGAGDSAEPAWRMHLTLDLPQLGKVDAELQLAGPRLVARLKASPDSAASLLHHSDNFRERIAGTGLELKSFAVRESNDDHDAMQEIKPGETRHG